MGTPEPEKITTERWLEIIRPVVEDFSDRKGQEVAWFNPGPDGPVSSPIELICLLDGYMFGDASQDPELNLSEAQRAACLSFAKMVKAFAREHRGKLNERDVIDDPDWEKIRVAAGELLKILSS